MKKLVTILLALLLFPAIQAAAQTELTVYTAVEVELMAPYKKSFEAANPGITVTWVRGSAGITTSRLLAEKDAPKADVIFGLTVTSMDVLDKAGLLQPYKVKSYDTIPTFMRDSRPQPLWTGMSACPAALVINKREFAKLGLPLPKTWQDLTDPRYKGHIVMSSPASSGTAYTIVSSWIQAWGADKAWSYMKALDANIKMYAQSGAQPCEMTARGEIAMGLSEAAFARSLIQKGAPMEVILLNNPVPLDMEASALSKGTKKLEAAQKFLDWAASEKLASIVAERACVTANTNVTQAEAKGIPAAMGNYDFAKAGQEREAIINQWRATFKR